MLNLSELQEDLQALHKAIDQEAPLQEIRIATLRALTRHRFFTEDFMKATGDWKPHIQNEERDRRHEEFCNEQRSELKRFATEPGGLKKAGEWLRTQVPPLPEQISERARQPLGQFLKHIVHRLASVCLRDREEEAEEHYQRETCSFETELEEKQNASEFMEKMSSESREELMENAIESMKDREDRAEPGADWMDMEELIGSDEAFETNRNRNLQEDGQELGLYLMILERRLKKGESYSGLDLINDQEPIPCPSEKPDWESGKVRDELIAKLEAITGLSFRIKD